MPRKKRKARPKNRVTVKYVRMHPGTRPQPYLMPAFEVGKTILQAQVRKALKEWESNPGAKLLPAMDRAVKVAAFQTEALAKMRCPVDKGRLRASIHARKAGELYYTVGTNVAYAPHVEFGTKAHGPIRPRVKKALSWKIRAR